MTMVRPLPAAMQPLVDIRDLRIGIGRGRGEPLIVVDNATFKVRRGEMLGLIGESGSGKTMVCRSLIGTLHSARCPDPVGHDPSGRRRSRSW